MTAARALWATSLKWATPGSAVAKSSRRSLKRDLLAEPLQLRRSHQFSSHGRHSQQPRGGSIGTMAVIAIRGRTVNAKKSRDGRCSPE